MTLRACRACGDWHRLEEDWPAVCVGHFRINYHRSELSAPMIIKDEIGAVQSQLTGKIYDSKSGLRKEYKAHGVTEIGNEAPVNNAPKRPQISKDDIGKAIHMVKNGYRPNTEHAGVSASQTGSEWH